MITSRIQVENRQKLAKQILFNKNNLIPEVRLFVNKNNYYVLIAKQFSWKLHVIRK